MRRAIGIAASAELWVLCVALSGLGCVGLPDEPVEAVAEVDAAGVETLLLDGGAQRPQTGAPYMGPQCASAVSRDAGGAEAAPWEDLIEGADGGVDPVLEQASAGGMGLVIEGDPLPSLMRPSRAGDVVITELMIDPSARRDDDAEWIELWNASATEPLELTGCTLDDGGNTPRVLGELVIEANGLATIGRSVDAGFSPDLIVAMSFSNTADTAALICDGVEIDRVTYGAGFPLAAGASVALDPGAWSAVDNDLGDRWCSATDVYAGDRGTPGQPNPSCFEMADAGSDAGL